MLNEKKSGAVWLVVVYCLILIFLLFYLRFTMRYFSVQVNGASMNDTLYGGVYDVHTNRYFGGDFLYADREAEVTRGDIVILDVTENRGFVADEERRELISVGERKYIIKRAIAFGGEAVRCVDGTVEVRMAGESAFTPLEEPYLNYKTGDFGAVEVGEGEFFFLGDHRTNSSDSRAKGSAPLEDVVGVVPDWAVTFKSQITGWERFRAFLGGYEV